MAGLDAKQRRYDGIDFDQLYKRLRVYAEGLTRFMPEVFDGVSAGDLVNDVLLAFWESPDGLGWKPAKGKLVTFLLTVLKNRFIDRYRRTQKMQASLDDPDGGSPEPSCTPIDTLEYQDFLQQLRNRIGERPDWNRVDDQGRLSVDPIHHSLPRCCWWITYD